MTAASLPRVSVVGLGKLGAPLAAVLASRGFTVVGLDVSKTLVAVLDWGLDAQQATSFVNFGAANSPTTGVGGEHPLINTSNNGANDALVTGLRARGHTVSITAQSSGVATILRTSGSGGAGASYQGAADPRREGIALGGP